MKILITGGGGYLGSILTRKLLEKNYEVRVLDPMWYGKESLQECFDNSNFELVQEDMRNLISTVKSMKGVDGVIHLASLVGMPVSNIEPRTSEEINYLATKNIAELCQLHEIQTYIFASTCSVYGAQPNKLITEKSPTAPLDFYARQKWLSERAIGWLNRAPTILRFGTLFGMSHRIRFDLVINLFIAQALTDGKITVHGGEQFRPFLHVQDAADCLVFALENDLTGVYNVVSENLTILDAAKRIQSLSGCEVIISKDITDERNYKVSSKKINSTGFLAKRKIEDAFTEIKKAIETKSIDNYKNKIYSNYEFLYSSKEIQEKVFIQGMNED